jgi:CO/xanthine dehydrogenase Mo-binding subunit
MKNTAEFSRREFLKSSGVLIVSFSAAGATGAPGQSPALAQGAAGDQVDSWIAIAADGRVTAYTGKSELGQGLYTAQTQLIAEELVVPLARVRLVQCDTAITPDQGTTSGSQSHPENFNRDNLAQAAATAREALFRLASERLRVPIDQLTVKDGVIGVKTDPARSVGYGELIGGRRFSIPLDKNARRRPAGEWSVLGTAVPRLEIPAMVMGEFEFVHNVRVPGMLHGRMVRPPAVGATLVSIDEASVRDVPGLVKVVVKNNFVGIVCQKPWQAVQAARTLKATWTPGVGLPSHGRFDEHLRNQKATRDTLVVDSKDVDAKLAQATHPLKRTAAMILGLQPENVRVIFRLGFGCYGINGADAVSYDAALLSQAVGKPVRVQLMRKDEMAWENFGAAYLVDERAGLDADGRIIAWDYEAWTPTLGGRPRYRSPGNIITGLLVGFQPDAFTPASPAPEPTGAFSNRSNAAPPYVAGCVGGRCGGTGTIKSERVLSHSVRSPFFTGPLRSPARLQNTFAHESFMDELAARAKADPVAFRLQHLSDPRLRDVVNAAAKAASWDARRSPKSGARKTGIATGHGIACVLYEGDNGYSAMVAEVEVNQDSGQVAVKRMVVSVDCGPISNPDGLRNQIEGGALQGASRALMEEATWDDTKVTSIDWRTLQSWYLDSKIPTVESVLLNRPDAEAAGVGETSITSVAAAIANAIFDATGARLRQVPFTPERVKAALAARA